MLESIRQYNLDHTRVICKSLRNPHPELITVQDISKTANAFEDLIKADDDRLVQKPEGILLDSVENVPDPAAATNDTYKARIGKTAVGYSIITESKFWVTLSEEEAAKAVEVIKAGLGMRYHNEYDQWLDGLIDGDRDIIVNLFAGIVTHGAKREKNSFLAVIDNIERINKKMNMSLPHLGSINADVSQIVSSTLTTMQSGQTFRMECRFTIKTTCAKVTEIDTGNSIDVSGLRIGRNGA